jgi:amino acid transporter
MNTLRLFSKFAAILVVVLVTVSSLFLFDKFLDRKLKGPDRLIWRWRVGIAQCIMAGTFFWAKGYYLAYKGFLNNIISIGIVILALGGIGEIIIALLCSASENKK